MVRVGVINSRCERVMFADADGATPFAEVEKLESALAQGHDVAIGSRKVKDPTRTVRNSVFRSAVTSTFNGLVSALVIQGIDDTQCGFKLFPRRVALDLFRNQTIDGFSFDVEILYISRLRGYRIAEVPINWHAVPGSKVRVVRDGLRMARDLFLIRSRALRGLYATAPEPEPVGTPS
jgi:dolichyl-phosphate beta-glucosyltransferase